MGRRRPGRHRLPPVYSPVRSLFGTGVLLALASGLIAAAIKEASAAGDTGWALFFTAMLFIDVVLYWNVMSDWGYLVSDRPVDRSVARGVSFGHDNDHQGDHRNPGPAH